MAFNWNEHPTENQEEDSFDWSAHTVEAQKPEEVSPLESGARGAAQGLSFGFADELTGGAEALWEKAKGNPAVFGDLYKQYRDESRLNYKKAEEANPGTYMASNFVGAAAPIAASGGTSVLAKALATVPGMAAQGAAQSIGMSEADLTKGDYLGAAKDAAIGGALGGAVGKVAQIPLGKIASSTADSLSGAAERLAARSLGAEKGIVKKLGEDKVRDIGRYALDEGIVSEGLSANPFKWLKSSSATDDMASKNDALKQAAGEQMSKVYDAIDNAGISQFNPMKVAQRIEEELGGFYRSPINRGETKQLENTIESVLLRGDRNLPIRDAQLLKEELGKVANWKNNLNITDKEKMARDAYRIVSEEIDNATELAASQLGDDALPGLLKEGKKSYSTAKGAEQMLDNRLAREQGNKLFGLTDSIVGAGGFATGEPLTSAIAVGTKKLGEKYGTQAAAIGLDKLSDVVRSTPQAFGKFSKPLQDAAARGGSSLGATHFILQSTNPEYRQILQQNEFMPGEPVED